MSSRLQTLEELLADNSPRLAVQGKKILEELAIFQQTPFIVELLITEPEVRLDAGDIMLLNKLRGKINPDIHKLTSPRQKRFVRRNDTKLTNRPLSVHFINDEVWTCQYNATVQIFDRNLNCIRTLSDQ